ITGSKTIRRGSVLADQHSGPPAFRPLKTRDYIFDVPRRERRAQACIDNRGLLNLSRQTQSPQLAHNVIADFRMLARADGMRALCDNRKMLHGARSRELHGWRVGGDD